MSIGQWINYDSFNLVELIDEVKTRVEEPFRSDDTIHGAMIVGKDYYGLKEELKKFLIRCDNIKNQANDNRIKVKEQINAMYEHGYTIEDIADNLSDGDCVQSFRSCPDWCGEDSDCYDCWTKCLEMELVNVDE